MSLSSDDKKLNIVQINSVCYGSTGKLMRQIQKKAVSQGHNATIFFGRGEEPSVKEEDGNFVKFGNKFDFYNHALNARLFGLNGRYSKHVTYDLISQIDRIKPDIIHMHNIHGYYIHLETLFNYLKDTDARIIWTLHDCWSFTGRCAFFEDINCEKWINGCEKCPRKSVYPASYYDNCKNEYTLKKRLFNFPENMTIVTPCNWLKELVNKSFLKKYPVVCINNGIDINLFKRNENRDEVNSYLSGIGVNGRKVVLAVANIWEERKRLDLIALLAKMFSEREDNIVVVAVGLSDKQIDMYKNISNFIGLKRTRDVNELVTLYSGSDVFVSTAVEETFPLVSLEAMACGLPSVSIKAGGNYEQINGEVGIILSPDEVKRDISFLYEAVLHVLNSDNDYTTLCRKRAEMLYSDDLMVRRYLDLYINENSF